jgi:mannose-6-phosphate isomerase-like protein (cupin superfamily)
LILGAIIEVLSSQKSPGLDIAVVLNIKATRAHYHIGFEEIYFVLDGYITLGLYDPKADNFSEVVLETHELMVIKPGIHHKVVAASMKNRIAVISLPGFDPNDEHLSEKF